MNLAGLLSGWRRSAVSAAAAAPPAHATAVTQSIARTHVGRVRTINEDRVFASTEHGLWAVADGMGGHFAGDVAAEAIIETLRALVGSPSTPDDDMIETSLIAAGRHIHAGNAGSSRVSGSTIVALHADGDSATLFWAGDSRAYRARDGRLERLSRDHSLVQELVDSGALTPEQADRHPQAHVITRALGAAAEVAIDRRDVTVRPGDLFLLCSDGLTRGHADPALLEYCGRPLATIADELMADALAAGGADNISLVLIAIG